MIDSVKCFGKVQHQNVHRFSRCIQCVLLPMDKLYQGAYSGSATQTSRLKGVWFYQAENSLCVILVMLRLRLPVGRTTDFQEPHLYICDA